ncbi:unnamed protein product [Protopolystoma xenopodis]|uniref:Uncharacterized protein n=1 Tax=Protopolystoma xenopodis TaxID=117903 RepID=A0A3S5C4Q3_9PLAT|nr:unnamed protein product [Protopolystoma xenopodis]
MSTVLVTGNLVAQAAQASFRPPRLSHIYIMASSHIVFVCVCVCAFRGVKTITNAVSRNGGEEPDSGPSEYTGKRDLADRKMGFTPTEEVTHAQDLQTYLVELTMSTHLSRLCSFLIFVSLDCRNIFVCMPSLSICLGQKTTKPLQPTVNERLFVTSQKVHDKGGGKSAPVCMPVRAISFSNCLMQDKSNDTTAAVAAFVAVADAVAVAVAGSLNIAEGQWDINGRRLRFRPEGCQLQDRCRSGCPGDFTEESSPDRYGTCSGGRFEHSC